MHTDHQWHGDDRELRELLEARRRQLTEDLQLRITRIRENGSHALTAPEPDDGDPCDLDVRLLEISAATLRHVDLALTRLDEGRYGRCTRCGGRIARERLRAMPFASCCRPCEDARERDTHSRPPAPRRWLWSEGYVTEP
jgi:RNA polymerase-binding transcription factor DksA